jgi:DNA-directed RNA polymerase beta subunit
MVEFITTWKEEGEEIELYKCVNFSELDPKELSEQVENMIMSCKEKAIAKSYGEYKNQLKRNKKDASLTIKQSAVIDAILADPTSKDLSILNAILEAEANNELSFKGLSGMNSDRSYSLDKRTFDDSMMGILASSTGFAANVGITRQASINSNIKGNRGLIVTPKEKDLNTLNTLCITEALTPFGSTHDDPIRTAMAFIQTSKHQMRVKKASPNLVTMGMDEALPYITSDIFSYKFKYKKGKVIEVTDDYLIYELNDDTINGKTRKPDRGYVDLRETVMKNSDGGFFVTVKLDPCVKKGDTLNYNDILAYDKSSYSKAIGTSKNEKNISYNIGTLAKIGVLTTDEAYEDSAIIDNYLSDALTSTYCVKKERALAKDTNVYNVVKKGDPIEEGDPLIVFQNAFEEKDANALLKSITDDDVEAVSDLGRIHVRSKLTGYVQDVKIYRTCELDELSPSLKKLVTAYEAEIKKTKKIFKDNDITGMEHTLEPDYKLPPTGKLKGIDNGVLIEFYIKCEDKFGIGDKLVYNSAIKGVGKDIIPEGDEPYTDFRPNEPINALLTTSSINARMVGSIILNGAMNKLLIELDRKCKELLGIEWKTLDKM